MLLSGTFLDLLSCSHCCLLSAHPSIFLSAKHYYPVSIFSFYLRFFERPCWLSVRISPMMRRDIEHSVPFSWEVRISPSERYVGIQQPFDGKMGDPMPIRTAVPAKHY